MSYVPIDPTIEERFALLEQHRNLLHEQFNRLERETLRELKSMQAKLNAMHGKIKGKSK